MRPDDATRVAHMIDAGESAMRFTADRRREDLDSDEMLRFALVRAIEIIGEAASRVSSETRSSSASVPWSAITFMRNRLIHAYFDIDRAILWKTATEELPELLARLRPLLD